MHDQTDTSIQTRIEELLDRAGLTLVVDVSETRARVTGAVDSRSEYNAALELIKSVQGVSAIEDEIEIETTAPDSAFDESMTAAGFEFVENPASLYDDDGELEGDFSDNSGAGAINFQEAIEEAEPYFPPTDPVVAPVNDDEDLEVVGGFQDTAMENLAEDPELDSSEVAAESPLAGQRGDESIRDDVIRALRADALTTDLALDVDVSRGIVALRGTVPALDDAINAEEVARRIPGTVDVHDETTIDQ